MGGTSAWNTVEVFPAGGKGWCTLPSLPHNRCHNDYDDDDDDE